MAIKLVSHRQNAILFNNYLVILQSDISGDEREVSQLELETWCNENSIASCIETSAKNASNVQEAFKLAVQHWLKAEMRADKYESNYNDTIDLSRKNVDNRNSCCLGSSEE